VNRKLSFNLTQWLRSRTGLVLLVFLAIAVFFLVTEHTAHVFGILPYLLLFLCPLLHLFMHGGHGESSGHAEHVESSQQNSEGGK
jgi:Na+/glutamate symporter